MPIKFQPRFSLTPKILNYAIKTSVLQEKVLHLPLTLSVLQSLRESARLDSTHFSTYIEGNRLTLEQIEKVVLHEGSFPGRERDEREVKAYYAAFDQVETWAARGEKLTEKMIQTIHALVMSDGRKTVKPTPYRDGQNIIREARTRAIVYLPPEAKDVPGLMRGLVDWIHESKELPIPIVAAIAHYQFATIHPYYDGNGRTARLLATLILHLGGYDLKGLYSLEEYYARGLGNYYTALQVGPSHNYYHGRAEADITHWVEYFIEGMMISFERVLARMEEAKQKGELDQATELKQYDVKQRKALELFSSFDTVTARQIGDLFGFRPRTASHLCKQWVEEGFLKIVNPSKKGRKYRLGLL